jgi:hypothetical protein
MSKYNRDYFVMDLGPSPEEIRYQNCLSMIVAEFESDPMSVQCFDLRVVAQAKKLVAEYEQRHARYFRKYGRADEQMVIAQEAGAVA